MIHAQEALNKLQHENIEFIDFRFTDILGKWHHLTYHISAIGDQELLVGVMFDGSSIAGWKEVNESDMLLKPDLNTLYIDPFTTQSTGVLICDVIDPATGKGYVRDPRTIARAAENYLSHSKIGDNIYFGPELEFFIFDDVRFQTHPHASSFTLNSREASYNSNAEYQSANLGFYAGIKGGYMPTPPIDSANEIRSEIMMVAKAIGLIPTLHHHEVAEGQHEIGFKYDKLLNTADNVQKCKHLIKNLVASYGKSATFMPKPMKGENGSGMHLHQSIWNGNDNLFYSQGNYADLSELCLYYIGGIMKHAKAINAFSNPTTNSYKRLVPGYEAPVLLAYSARNRSGAIRIPYTTSSKAKRIEARFPDPTANAYLSFAAMMMAGLDGINNKIHPGKPNDQNLYALAKDEANKLPTLATSLREALDALSRDRQFLKEGGVFSDDMIDSYIKLKMQEVEEWEAAPHPIEFKMYYGL